MSPRYCCSTVLSGVGYMGSSGAELVSELEEGLGKRTQTGVLITLGVLVTQGQSWFVGWKAVS